MQISKRVVVFGAAGLILLGPTAFSADNPDQAKARQALDQYYSQGGTNPSVPATAPAKASAVQPQADTPLTSVGASQSSDQAREALRRKMAELDAGQTSRVTQQPMLRSQPSTAKKKQESEAIAKAREAVRQKFAEMDAQARQATSQAPAVAPQPQAAPQPPAVVQPPAAQQATDPAAIERSREQLRKRMAELEAQQPAQAPKAQAPSAASGPAVDPRFSDLPLDQADARKTQEAREALRKKMESLPPESAVAAKQEPKPAKQEMAVKPVKEKPAKEVAVPAREEKAKPVKAAPVAVPAEKAPATAQEAPAGKAQEKKPVQAEQPRQKQVPQYKTLQAPPVPFSEDQQAKLAELLKKYRADELTPEQYHAERAKIIGNR